DVPALKRAIQSDGFWGVAVQAAGALSEIKGPAARDALIECLSVAHPKARRAGARALGNFKTDAGAATALMRLLEKGDASYFVEAEAAKALGRTRDPRAWDVLVAVRERPSYLAVIR